MYKSELISKIREFTSLAGFTDIIFRRNFEIHQTPLQDYKKGLIPKKGQMYNGEEIIQYEFHGLGCRFLITDRVLDFNYSGPNWIFEGVSMHSIWEYLEPDSLYGNQTELEDDLLALENDGLIYRVKPEFYMFRLVVNG